MEILNLVPEILVVHKPLSIVLSYCFIGKPRYANVMLCSVDSVCSIADPASSEKPFLKKGKIYGWG